MIQNPGRTHRWTLTDGTTVQISQMSPYHTRTIVAWLSFHHRDLFSNMVSLCVCDLLFCFSHWLRAVANWDFRPPLNPSSLLNRVFVSEAEQASYIFCQDWWKHLVCKRLQICFGVSGWRSVTTQSKAGNSCLISGLRPQVSIPTIQRPFLIVINLLLNNILLKCACQEKRQVYWVSGPV